MKTKHKLLKLIHLLGNVFDCKVHFFPFKSVQIQRVMGQNSKEYQLGIPFQSH